MSQEVILNTGNQAIINTDTSKMFVWNNRYETATFAKAENDTGSAITVPKGTLMGRVTSTLKLKELASGAADGSQTPVGILAHDVVIENEVTFDGTVTICVAGDVVEDKVVLQGSDTMNTTVGGRTIHDLIQASTVGIKLVGDIDNSAYDNQ